MRGSDPVHAQGRWIDAAPSSNVAFHFTRLEHLPTIVATGLQCDRRAQADGVLAIEVGNQDVKALRSTRSVRVEPGGDVADYVPFYFAPRSPTMYVIHCGGVPSYRDGTDRIVYLGSTLERLQELDLDVVLSDRNAALRVADFHRWADGEPEENFIDWPLMEGRMWNSDAEHPDRMERRMAECLVHGAVPWEAIQFVGAKSQTVLDEVAAVLEGAEHVPGIKDSSGNLLRADAEALVNTVNTEGVMGKGIALQFKKAYPAMYEAYRNACKGGNVHLGQMHVWPTGQMTGPKYIINFPTKGHWKSKSKLKDIESGLSDLIKVIQELGIKSVAVPPLGCGNGGLDWRDVEPKIAEAFEQVSDVDVLLFSPAGAPAAAEMTTATQRPAMNANRAALVEMLRRYTSQSLMAPGLVESQKLLYFLQVAGQPLRLNFKQHYYGPYADNLRHVLNLVEGHFISGFGDGSAPVADAEPLAVLPGAADEAESVLAGDEETKDRIRRVISLAEGFESAYGLELLATAHWVASHEAVASDDELVRKVWDWSPRKARMFTEGHVRIALEALRGQGWLAQDFVPA